MTNFSEFNGIFIGELCHLPLFREKKCAFLTKKTANIGKNYTFCHYFCS